MVQNKKEIKLTKKEKKFADEYLQTGNGTQSILKAYDTDKEKVAWVMAVENLTKPRIRAYLDDKWDDAGCVLEELMNNAKKEDVRLNAWKFIYEQVHWKATQRAEIKHEGDLSHNIVYLPQKTLEDNAE